MSQVAAPGRIVSLVPSLTEALIHLGCGDRLVGRTRFCVEPAEIVGAIEAVGGTKNPDIERVVALRPDLVVLNKEENRREDWEALVGAGLRVFVTHPRTVSEAADMLEKLGTTAGVAEAGAQLAEDCRQALETARRRARTRAPLRVFCPIWRNPWMTSRVSTYIGNVLAAAGLDSVYGDEGEADFFAVEVADALAREPEVIVLPDEPYAFSRKHGDELRRAGAKAVILYVDGKDLAWYGPRIPSALERLWIITADISRA